MWDPKLSEVAKALLFVLTDIQPGEELDAMFVHGSPSINDKYERSVLQVAADSCLRYGHPIVLNGLTKEECAKKGLSYRGSEMMVADLLEFGVPREKILLIPSAEHTALEAKAVVKMSKENGMRVWGICTQDQHQLRCFLTNIAEVERDGYHLDLYNYSPRYLDWFDEYLKPVLRGGLIEGTMDAHSEAETERLVAYAQDPAETGGSYTRHATIPEMFAYVAKDARRRKKKQ